MQVLAIERDGGHQSEPVRPRYRADRAVLIPRHPGNSAAIIEAHDEIGIELDAPALPDHQAHEVAGTVARRHEVDQGRDAVGRLERGLENERIRPIAAGYACIGIPGGDVPAPVLDGAEQSREAGPGVETGKQSQSIEPVRDTSATVSQSPISA